MIHTRMLGAPMQEGTPRTVDPANEALPFDTLRGERILWSGRPDVPGLARHFLRVWWVALYLAIFVVIGLYMDRSRGASIAVALRNALPMTALCAAFVIGLHLFAYAWARTTRYFVTTERCVLHIGIALTGTLSLPLHRIASVSIALRGDGSGDLALAPKPPHRLRFVTLWPHARAWHFLQPQPMMRCIPHAAFVGDQVRLAIDDAASARNRTLAGGVPGRVPVQAGG